MDCNKANELMMKFMDKILPKSDMERLEEHFASCKTCKEDFLVYNEIMSNFSDIELVSAPDDLEIKVMKRIEELSLAKDKITNSLDNFMYWCFGVFSMLIGVSFIFTLYKDKIIDYMYNVPGLVIFADFFISLSDYTTRFSANLTLLTNDLLASASGYFSYARYALIGIFIILGIVQFILYRKDKVEA